MINTARGPIVDEKASLRALKTKRIAGAALDVFECEPEIDCDLTDKLELKAFPNVVLTCIRPARPSRRDGDVAIRRTEHPLRFSWQGAADAGEVRPPSIPSSRKDGTWTRRSGSESAEPRHVSRALRHEADLATRALAERRMWGVFRVR